MAPASLSTSGSSRLSQFGLYRSIDARAEEFMKLSRRRQLRQGCACAAISTIVTVTVVIVLILVYLQSMTTSESTVARNRRPQKWEIINNAKDENAMNSISKDGENKLKQARVNSLLNDRLNKSTEAPPTLTDIEQFSKIKNTFPSIRHLMKVANRTFPIEYKSPRLNYSKFLKNRVNIISKIRRFKPLLEKGTKSFQKENKKNSHNTVKKKETNYNLNIETKSTTEKFIIDSVKTKYGVKNLTSNNKNLHTGLQLNKNVRIQRIASNVSKNQNSEKKNMLEDLKVLTKKGPRHVNGTLNLLTNSSSSLNTMIENQLTQFVIETDLCNNKDLLRHFLDKLISICKKDKTKSKCKMACCNKNKTTSEKPIIKTNVTVNAGNAISKITPHQSTYTSTPSPTIPTTTTTTKRPFVKYLKYVAGDKNYEYDYVPTETTTMAPDQTKMNMIKPTNIFLQNKTLKYPTKPISDIISLQTNQGGQTFQVNQIRDLLNDQEATTTTELTITTNSNYLTFAPTLQLYENTDDADKIMGVTNEDSMKESASSSFYDNFLPEKNRVHQDHLFVKAIKSNTEAIENENTFENINGDEYSRLPGKSVNFDKNKMKEFENIKSKHEVNLRTDKHDLFQPYHTIKTTVDQRINTKSYTNFDSTVLKNDDDDDDKNQKYKATTNTSELVRSDSNSKILPLTSNKIYDFIQENPKVTLNTIKPLKRIQALNNERIIAENIRFSQNNNDRIRPKIVGTYVLPIKNIKSFVKDETVTEDLSISNRRENLLVKNTGVIITRPADEWINHKVNKIKSTAMFTTEAVGINLSRQTPSVLSQDMKTIAMQKSKYMRVLPLNYISDKEVFDEVRDQNKTREMRPHLKYSAKLGFHVAPPVKDKKIFENMSSDNVTMNKKDFMSKKLRVLCFIHDPHKKKVQSILSAINSNEMHEVQVKDNLLLHDNIDMNSEKISEELLNLLDTARIDENIQNKLKSKISNSNINEGANMSITQPIERNESNIFREIKHVMSSIKQTADERESTEDLATTTKLTINFESEEGSKEIGFKTESYDQNTLLTRNLPWYRIDLLDAQRNIERTNQRILNQFLQPPKPNSEEHEDTTQSKIMPETSTYTQIQNKILQNSKVSERKMRTVDSVENLSESTKKIEVNNIKNNLQPQKSYSHNFESTTEIKPLLGSTIQRYQPQQAVRDCGDKCELSEENAKAIDRYETLGDLDIDALIKRRHAEWIKKKQVILLIYEYTIAVESGVVQIRGGVRHLNDSTILNDTPVADRLDRTYLGFDQDYLEQMPLLVNAMQENSYVDTSIELSLPADKKTRYLTYTTTRRPLLHVNRYNSVIRRTSPRPFIFEYKSPTPVPFHKNFNSRSWVESYRNAQRLKNLEQVIGYLEKTINAKFGDLYTLPSNSHITFTGLFLPGSKDSKKESPATNTDTVTESSQHVNLVKNLLSNHQSDPYYSFKPESPGDVNLLADAPLRLAPTAAPIARPSFKIPMFRPIPRLKGCVGTRCGIHGNVEKNILNLLQGTNDSSSAETSLYEKPKSFSVLLNLFSVTPSPSSLYTKQEVQTPYPYTSPDQIYITTAKSPFLFRRKSTTSVGHKRPFVYRSKRPRLMTHSRIGSSGIFESQQFSSEENQSKSESGPKMILQVNLYPKTENKPTTQMLPLSSTKEIPETSTQPTTTTVKSNKTKYHYNIENRPEVPTCPPLCSTNVEDFHVGSSGVIPVEERTYTPPTTSLPVVTTMIPFFDSIMTSSEETLWSSQPTEILKFSQEDAKIPDHYKRLRELDEDSSLQPQTATRRNNGDNYSELVTQENEKTQQPEPETSSIEPQVITRRNYGDYDEEVALENKRKTLIIKLRNYLQRATPKTSTESTTEETITTTAEVEEESLEETTTVKTYVPQINGHYRSVNQNSKQINYWLSENTDPDRKRKLEITSSVIFKKPTAHYVEIRRRSDISDES